VLCFASEGLLGVRKLWPDTLRAFFLAVAVIFRGILFSSRIVSRTTRPSALYHIILPRGAPRWRFRVATLRSAGGIGCAVLSALHRRYRATAHRCARGIGCPTCGALRWRRGVTVFRSVCGIGIAP